MPELAVKRIRALGNLWPRIRDLYRKEKIDDATVRHLTLASKCQQKAWLTLFDDADAYCPTGRQFTAWLFGGDEIGTGTALFDLGDYTGQNHSDLFGTQQYLPDRHAFWAAQNRVNAARGEWERELER